MPNHRGIVGNDEVNEQSPKESNTTEKDTIERIHTILSEYGSKFKKSSLELKKLWAAYQYLVDEFQSPSVGSGRTRQLIEFGWRLRGILKGHWAIAVSLASLVSLTSTTAEAVMICRKRNYFYNFYASAVCNRIYAIGFWATTLLKVGEYTTNGTGQFHPEFGVALNSQWWTVKSVIELACVSNLRANII